MMNGPAIYLSAAMSRRDEIQGYADQLTAGGIRVVSTWHSRNEPIHDHELTANQRWEIAYRDLYELRQADSVVFFGDPDSTYTGTGGKFVELGYALGIDTFVYLVGNREGVFTFIPEIAHTETWDEMLPYLLSWQVVDLGAA